MAWFKGCDDFEMVSPNDPDPQDQGPMVQGQLLHPFDIAVNQAINAQYEALSPEERAARAAEIHAAREADFHQAWGDHGYGSDYESTEEDHYDDHWEEYGERMDLPEEEEDWEEELPLPTFEYLDTLPPGVVPNDEDENWDLECPLPVNNPPGAETR